MHLTQRGKRRLLLIMAIFAMLAVTVAALFVYRDYHRAHLALQARARGLEAYRKGSYETVLLELQYPFSRNRADLDVLLALADSQSKIVDINNRHLARAAGLYNEALNLDPDNLEALEALLWVYGRIGYHVEAVEVIDRILANHPDHIEALSAKYAILHTALRSGKLIEEDPADYARRLMALEPHEINWFKFLLETMRLNRAPMESMIALCDQWADEYKGDGRFYLLKSETLLVLGQYEASRESAITASERGANTLEILDLTLSLFDRLSLQSQSDDVFTQAREVLLEHTKTKFRDQPWVYEAMIRQHWRSGAYEQALATLDDAEKMIGDLNISLLRWKTLLHTASNQREEAMAALDRLQSFSADDTSSRRDGNRAWVQALQARLTVGESRWPDVIDRLKLAIELSQRDPILQFLLAEAYQNIAENELAAQAFLQAIIYDRLWLGPYVSCARSLLTLGRPMEAIGVLYGMLQRIPNVSIEPYVLFAEAWLASGQSSSGMGLLYDRQGRSLDLLSLLQSLHQATGHHPQITRLLLEALLASGEEASAKQLIRTVLESDTAPLETLLALAEVSRATELGLEEECLERARTVGGDSQQFAVAQALALHESGQSEKGLEVLTQAMQSFEGSPEVLSQVRRNRTAYLIQIDHPDSLMAMREILDAEPESHSAALFVISVEAAWQDPGLIEQAINQLARIAGENSPRVIIARANAILRFHVDEPAKLASALSQISQVLDLTPNSLPALTLMADLLLVGSDPDHDQAVRHIRTAVDNYPTIWALYPRLVAMFQRQGNFDAADEYLDRFGRRTEKIAALRQAELKLLHVQGSFETIVIRLRESLETMISFEEELLLADMYRRTGRRDQAEAVFTRLIVKDPNNANVVSKAASFLAVEDQYERALALLESYQSVDHPAARYLMLGRFYEEQHDLELAREQYERAVEIEPDNMEALERLAKYLVGIGDSQLAMELVTEELRRDPTNESLRITQALASLQLGPEGRSRALEIIEALGPSHRQWLETERLNDRVLNSSDPSNPTNRDLVDARRLIDAHERYLPAWRLAVILHANAGQMPEAVQLARRAAANLPLAAEPLEWATQLLVQNRFPHEALESARHWRQRMLEDPIDADAIIASLLLDLNRPDEALRQIEPYQVRIERDPMLFPKRVAIWLRILLHAGQFETALSLLSEYEPAREMWYSLCRELDVETSYEAIQFAEALRGQTPQEAYVLANEWILLGQRAHATTYFDKAEELCRVADQDESLMVPLLLLRAMIASGRDDFSSSERFYRRAIQIQPDHPGVLNNLAFALLKRDPKSVEALALSFRAVQLMPDNPDLLDTLAQALLGSRRLTEAAEFAEQAIVLRSGDPGLRLTLARIRLAQNRLDDVQAQLNRIQRQLNIMPLRDEKLWAEFSRIQKQIQDNRAAVSP